MDRAKRTRNQRKSVLSRHINALKRLLVEQDIPGIKARLESMKETFEELEDAHYEYHDALAESTDPSQEDIDRSDAWYEAEAKRYMDNVKAARDWLSEHGVVVKAEPDVKPSVASLGVPPSGSLLSSEVVTLLGLPKVEIQSFDGNPLHYQAFVSTFDQVIGNVISDDQAKLTRLLSYLTGEAQGAVKAAALVGGSAGYAQARKDLKFRFGRPYLVVQKVVADLKNGGSASRPSELRSLADDISAAHQILTKIGGCGEVNTQQFICDVLMRCHPQVRSRWRKQAFENFESRLEYPSFEQFASFMDKVAREACDPVYGYDNFKVNIKSASVNSVSGHPDSGHVNAEVSNTLTLDNGKCPICLESHDILMCGQFKAMPPEQRFQEARKKRLCFGCLSSSHMARNCPKSSPCQIGDCRRRHCRLLHVNQVTCNSDQSSAQNTAHDQDRPHISTSTCLAQCSRVKLPLITVLVNGFEPALALLDTGSTNTLVTEKFASKLGLQGERISCNLSTVGAVRPVITRLVSFDVAPLHDEGIFSIRHACVVSDIPAGEPAEDITMAEFPHLVNLPLGPCRKGARADILIGLDNPDLLAPLEVRRSVSKAGLPYATRTRLGWVLQGPISVRAKDQIIGATNHVSLDQLEDKIQHLWDVEHEDESVTSWSVEDRQVHDMWQERSEFQDGRYTVPIPWRPGRPCFVKNRFMAEKRLRSTLKKLHKTGMYEAYDENVKKLLSDGHAEPVPQALLARDDGGVWYLPHFAVLNDSKPGKVRIVFDCAAQNGGVSLNSECLQGPDLCTKLLHVLLRFRQYRYCMTADIKAMYLQVRIPEQDRDCLRFLWYNGEEIAEYRMTSHLFGGIWCASSSTYALRRVLEDFEVSDMTREAVGKAMYVDDLLKSVPLQAEVLQLIPEVTEALKKGGFELTKFMVNDMDILEKIPEDVRAQEAKVITPELHSKALGIKWNVSQDQFTYVRRAVEATPTVTKRTMLSNVASMYDPLGLIAPVVIQGRMIFQQATKIKIAWDDPVPHELLRRWTCWWEAIEKLDEVHFDRCVVPSGFSDGAMELHHFCDGSQHAYGACSYIRILSKTGLIHVQLLMSKVRLVPVHPMTIPRIELCAAVIAVRIDEVLRRELDLELLPSTFWSDSQVTLSYIRSDAHRFRVFVGNRVARIRSSTTPEQWKYVPSQENPADVLSRGCLPSAIPEEWKVGPSYLQQHRDQWKVQDWNVSVCSKEDPEEKKVVCSTTLEDQEDHPLDVLMKHYSELHRLIRAVAWWRRWLKMKIGKQVASSDLTLEEIKEAEEVLIVRVQSEVYREEINRLEKGKPVSKTSSLVRLDPMMLRGRLAVRGRLKHAPLCLTERHPLILPPRHRLSRLILEDAHNRAHLGTEWVLSRVRRKYWIPSARNMLRDIRRSCVKCQRLYGVPREQKMADLPEERCKPGPVAFRHVGVDLFGPFYVTQGRSTVKRYGCVFTCFSVRAIHIEVLASLETDTFINGFRRFCARRGKPETIRSDQGTNLVGASEELADEMRRLDKSQITNAAQRMEVDWTFNPPLASHQGGVWERMIRTIRRVLMAVIPTTAMTDEVLSTALCEVEGIVNGRPLTKCSMDVLDESPLTPNHFLLQEGNYPISWRIFHKGEAYRKRWMQVQNIVASFWKRWLREYLPELQRRQKWETESTNYKIGDLVLMKDEQAPRGQWPLALVKEVHTGRDQKVRSVRLKVRETELVRPITKIIPLEVC